LRDQLDGFIDDQYHSFQFPRRDRKRGHENNHVPERPDNEAALPALQDHPDPDLFLERVGLLRPPVFDELDADHKSPLPDLAYVFEEVEPLQFSR